MYRAVHGAVYGQFSGLDLLCGAVFPLSLPLSYEDECGDRELAVGGVANWSGRNVDAIPQRYPNMPTPD